MIDGAVRPREPVPVCARARAVLEAYRPPFGLLNEAIEDEPSSTTDPAPSLAVPRLGTDGGHKSSGDGVAAIRAAKRPF